MRGAEGSEHDEAQETVRRLRSDLLELRNGRPARPGESGLRLMLAAPIDRTFQIGETVRFTVSGARGGYLVVFNIDERGSVTLLYPNPGTPSERVPDHYSRTVPNPERVVWRLTGPAGRETVEAIVSDMAIDFDDGLPRSVPVRPLGKVAARALAFVVRKLVAEERPAEYASCVFDVVDNRRDRR